MEHLRRNFILMNYDLHPGDYIDKFYEVGKEKDSSCLRIAEMKQYKGLNEYKKNKERLMEVIYTITI